jgi:hypothetical protein
MQDYTTGGASVADVPTAESIAFADFALRLRALVVDPVVLTSALSDIAWECTAKGPEPTGSSSRPIAPRFE